MASPEALVAQVGMRAKWLPLMLVLAACEGNIANPSKAFEPDPWVPGSAGGGVVNGTGGGTPSSPPLPCAAAATGPAPVLRLTPGQLAVALDELLGPSTGSAPWNEPADFAGFSTSVESNLTTEQEVEQLLNSVEARAAAATGSPSALAALVGCDVAATGCATRFVTGFGRRAFRRPMAPDEVTLFVQLLNGARQRGTPDARAVAMTLEAMLQSPQFLYRDEGFDVVQAGAQARLGPHGLASRLSFFLWNAPPDALLRTAADNGALADPPQFEQHARRLLADPRATPTLSRFHREWLQLHRLQRASKNPQLFPTFGSLRASLVEEQARFVDRARRENRFTFRELMTSRRTEVDPGLARHYGLPPHPIGWLSVELPATQRSGLLTLAGQMAAEAGTNDTSVVVRGHVVRTRILCQTVPPPPTGVTTQGSTSLSRLADPACMGCHNLMDPVGQGLENYDAVGAWRTTASGNPIDATGRLLSAGEQSGAFSGGPELTTRLAENAGARACYVTQWFRYARGRYETPEDRCALERLSHLFEQSNGDIEQLLLSFVTSDAFTHQGAVQP